MNSIRRVYGKDITDHDLHPVSHAHLGTLLKLHWLDTPIPRRKLDRIRQFLRICRAHPDTLYALPYTTAPVPVGVVCVVDSTDPAILSEHTFFMVTQRTSTTMTLQPLHTIFHGSSQLVPQTDLDICLNRAYTVNDDARPGHATADPDLPCTLSIIEHRAGEYDVHWTSQCNGLMMRLTTYDPSQTYKSATCIRAPKTYTHPWLDRSLFLSTLDALKLANADYDPTRSDAAVRLCKDMVTHTQPIPQHPLPARGAMDTVVLATVMCDYLPVSTRRAIAQTSRTFRDACRDYKAAQDRLLVNARAKLCSPRVAVAVHYYGFLATVKDYMTRYDAFELSTTAFPCGPGPCPYTLRANFIRRRSEELECLLLVLIDPHGFQRILIQCKFSPPRPFLYVFDAELTNTPLAQYAPCLISLFYDVIGDAAML